jgi:oligoribonuclease (3'-5' exoribonuclease)
VTFCYLDTETVGLNIDKHDIWEIAWAVGDGDILSSFVPHSLDDAEAKALEVNRYWSRMPVEIKKPEDLSTEFEEHLHDTLQAHRRGGKAVTIVGANPAFDTYRLARRWNGAEPWHYRLLDIGVYAMPYLSDYPVGLLEIANTLRKMGHEIPVPDHTAAGDVATVRACHVALASAYEAAGL